MEIKNEISEYIENISLILLGIVFLAFPLIVTPLTTDPFTLPKQIVVGIVSILLLLFLGVRMISDRAVRIRRTPFDVGILAFTVVTFLSSFFAVNRSDAFIAYVPLFISALFYFLIVNFVKNKQSLSFLLTAFIIGGTITSLLSILSFFHIYVLPFQFTQAQSFSPLGSLLDQIMYLLVLIPVAISIGWQPIKQILTVFGIFENPTQEQIAFDGQLAKTLGYLVASVIIAASIILSIYELFVLKPGGGLLMLPFEVGFQTGFAAISQDTGRTIWGLLFGSGFGTFLTDFTRFKQAVPLNTNQTLWSLSFIRSSSFILELLATTGLAGLATFCLLLFKISKRVQLKHTRENPLFFSMLFTIIACFLLPFSPIMQTVFFFLLAMFAVIEGLKDQHQFFDVELHFVAFKKGIIPFTAAPILDSAAQNAAARIEDKAFTKALPITFFTLFLILTSGIGFYSYKFIASDVLFQDSLVAYATNDGLKTYNNQTNAINLFPNRDAYYRIYAQTNLALANSIASQQQPGASPSAKTQQTILTLIQQSINAGRNATVISPLTSLNWQNLSSIYRSLIGFGQGASDFSIAAQQQAIALDQNNPQAYLILGGIYYQLGQWDNAEQKFQNAINLKPDFANAYYNFGHALESKGDLPNALLYYQTTRTLVANNSQDTKTIDDEIEVIKTKIGNAQNTSKQLEGAANLQPATNQPPLNINQPQNQLPERKPQVPLVSPTPTPSAK